MHIFTLNEGFTASRHHVFQVLNKEDFQKQMLEKLIWISAFMLVGARHPGATVGVVEKEYRSEVTFIYQ